MSKKIKAPKSLKDCKPLLREFFQLDSMVASANERKNEIKAALMPFMQKKNLDHLDSGEKRILYVEPKSTTFDLDKTKKILNDPKVKKLAKKHDIDLSELIQVTESVNNKILEELLAEKIITRKQVKKLIITNDLAPYLRSSSVPKSGTK